jgi:hypothetical protein
VKKKRRRRERENSPMEEPKRDGPQSTALDSYNWASKCR